MRKTSVGQLNFHACLVLIDSRRFYLLSFGKKPKQDTFPAQLIWKTQTEKRLH